jgi:hypothetical protein
MTMRSAAWLLTAMMLGVTSPAWAPQAGSAQTAAPVRVEWQSRDVGGGHAVISGYVYNEQLMRVQRIQLRVEPSSGTGGARIVYVAGGIPSRGREYFEVRVPAADAPYRVTVGLFDYSLCGSG